MEKIIELGATVQETGESRVSLLNASMVKTASTVIQDYWDSLEKSDRYAYLWVIGVSAQEYYGCNNNGDAFSEADLKKCHTDFVTNAHIFLHHVNKDPARSIGKPVFSWYNDDMHRVELILAVDKSIPLAAQTLKRLESGEQLYVSMGARLAYDVCSICGNKAPTRAQYCDHLRYNLRKILPDGRQVFSYNPNPHFFDISIVNRPADPTAFALDKIAGEQEEAPAKGSASLGEQAADYQSKLAAVRKVADIVKKVDGEIADAKSTSPLRVISEGHGAMEWPSMPYRSLDDAGISPAGFLSGMMHLSAPVTLQDMIWMAARSLFGRGCLGGDFSQQVMRTLPAALGILSSRPEVLSGMVGSIFSDYRGELEEPVHRTLVIRILRPAAEQRLSIMGGHSKLAFSEQPSFGIYDAMPRQYGATITEKAINTISPRSRNFSTVTFRDGCGHTVRTTPYFLRQAAMGRFLDSLPRKITGTALAAGAVAALLSNAGLAEKSLAAAAAGIPAIMLLAGSRTKDDITSQEGDTVSFRTLQNNAYKQHVKSAEDIFHANACAISQGVADNAILGMDYAMGLRPIKANI